MASNEFRLQISIPNKICIDKDVVMVTMPTVAGYTGILHGHIPIVGAIAPGFVKIKYANGTEQVGLLNYGLYFFKDNKLIILSDFFEFSCHGVDTNALEAIRLKIEEEAKKAQLSDKASHFLNSYMKLVSMKAREAGKGKK